MMYVTALFSAPRSPHGRAGGDVAVPQTSSILPVLRDTSADQMCALLNGSGDLYGRIGRLCFESPARSRDPAPTQGVPVAQQEGTRAARPPEPGSNRSRRAFRHGKKQVTSRAKCIHFHVISTQKCLPVGSAAASSLLPCTFCVTVLWWVQIPPAQHQLGTLSCCPCAAGSKHLQQSRGESTAVPPEGLQASTWIYEPNIYISCTNFPRS